MSLLANITQPNTADYYFALTNASAIQASNWSLYPAKQNVNVSGYAISLDNQLITADALNLYLNGSALATITTSAGNLSLWATFPASQNVNMSNFSISNVSGIRVNNGLTFPNGGGAVMSASGNACIVNGSDIVSRWASYGASQLVNISGQNVSNVNNITFNLAVPLPIIGNASINNLNSLNFSVATAGIIPPVGGQAEINNVNNIAFWNPNFPGIPFFYVNLHSRTAGQLTSDTRFACPQVLLNGGSICTTDAGGANGRYMLVNGYACPSSWSQFPAAQALNMNHNQILSCRQIDLAYTNAGPFNLLSIDNVGNFTIEGPNQGIVYGGNRGDAQQWSAYNALNTVNMNNQQISNLTQIRFANPANVLTTNAGNQLTYNGAIVQTGNGNTSNWAQFPANASVSIPYPHAFSVNGANSSTFKPNVTMHANIYHGVATFESFVQPDFVSYPSTFSVGSAVPGYSALNVDLNGGTEGVTIYSVTGVGILGDVDVDITAGGLLTFEAVGDINMTSAAITVETGAMNVTAAAVEVECATLGVVSTGFLNLGSATFSIETGLMDIGCGALGIECAAIGIASLAGVVITGGTTEITVGLTNITTGNLNFTTATAQFNATLGLSINTGASNTTFNGQAVIVDTNLLQVNCPLTATEGITISGTTSFNAGAVIINTSGMQVNCPLTISSSPLAVGTIIPVSGADITLSGGLLTPQLYSFLTPTPIEIFVPVTYAVAPQDYGRTLLLGADTGGQTFNINNTLIAANAGWFCYLRNIRTFDIAVTVSGTPIGTLYAALTTAQTPAAMLYWNGVNLVIY
jgi:hypothetical protein